MKPLSFTALEGLPEIQPGDDLVRLLCEAVERNGLIPADGDVLVICQKIVSKAENRFIDLSDIEPSPRARELSRQCRKDPRLVELVLRESSEVVRVARDVLIVRHRLGFVIANAAIDQSNVPGDDERALLLPDDPDASAASLCAALQARWQRRLAVLISDSFGRPWRMGVCGVCIGCSGMASLLDRRGLFDRDGRELRVTQIAAADEICAAATLMTGEGSEGRPAVWVRGVPAVYLEQSRPAVDLIRPRQQDLFR